MATTQLQPPFQHVIDAFTVPGSTFERLVDKFIAELDEGLAVEGVMPMIPAFVYHLPSGEETGPVLSVDFGGTNLRVCETMLKGKGEFDLKHEKWPISDEIKKGNGRVLFRWIAERIEEFLKARPTFDPSRTYPLGMTFSFPTVMEDIDVGKLLFWTKGFHGNDLVGQDIVAVLQECIDARGLPVKVNSLINDTVGTLLATAYKNPSCEVGIIFGTGTNCAYQEDQSNITKIKAGAANATSPSGKQLINTEWGAFGNKSGALPANDFDRILDKNSSRPGMMAYEKMVSGLYISELTRIVLQELALKGHLFNRKFSSREDLGRLGVKESFTGLHMGTLEGDESPSLDAIADHFKSSYGFDTTLEERRAIKAICSAISLRAAQLSSVGIAAIIKKRNLLDKPCKCTIGIDGSLFLKYPNFAQHLKESLYLAFGKDIVDRKVELIPAEDGSGVGGALAAFLTSQLKSK
ncbi:hexokinase A [Actinomortierella ambigua]|uniref:Phosphotransferase n=1 Tax=Actinomortierella ambigua TaxID=1343610 RepID=A0A9P6QJR5_9FUNG|nr:hexokinase A [Actinomortierella ambigua]